MQDSDTRASVQRERSFFQDPEWRALAWGVGGALTFVLAGLVVGLVEEGLLPWECEGMACLFTTVIVLYAGIVFAVWVVAGLTLAWARTRWPHSTWRLWALRVLAVLSWVPLVGLIVLALTG